MTEHQIANHDDECDGLDYPTGKPLTAYKQGLDDGYDMGKETVDEVSRWNWWQGFYFGCVAAVFASGLIRYLG